MTTANAARRFGDARANAFGMRDRRGDVQRHRAGRIQARGARAIEVGGVERLRRAARVGEIEHDQVVGLGRAAHEGEPVLDLEREPRIVERAAVHRAEVLARDVDDREVDLDQRHRLHRRVLEQLFGRAAVAAADDQRRLGRRMRDRREVDEILVIEELVLLRRHEVTVEPEQLPERRGVVDFDGLERRLEMLELARRADEEAGVVGQVLGQQPGLQVSAPPLLLRHRAPRDGSPGTSCAAASARPAWRGTAAPPWRCCRSCSCRRRRRSSRSRARARCGSRGAIRRAARYR